MTSCGLKMTCQVCEKKKADRNLREGTAWIARQKEEEGVISLPSGLMYKVLRSGKGKVHPGPYDRVEVHYRGKVGMEDRDFHDTYKSEFGKPDTLKVEAMVAGWAEATQLMVRGDMWELYIPQDLAYGTRGYNPYRIRANEALLFKVELVDIVDKPENMDMADEKEEL